MGSVGVRGMRLAAINFFEAALIQPTDMNNTIMNAAALLKKQRIRLAKLSR
jgi:hypothetical protein